MAIEQLTIRRLRLLSYLEELDELSEFERFVNRLIFQKKGYFLQELGAKLGYSFGFYIRGPYSSDLADDGFYIAGLLKLQASASVKDLLPKIDKITLENSKRFFKEIESLDSEKGEDYWYELASSLHFIYKHAFPKVRSKDEAFLRLENVKPNWFKEEDKETVWTLLRTFGLID